MKNKLLVGDAVSHSEVPYGASYRMDTNITDPINKNGVPDDAVCYVAELPDRGTSFDYAICDINRMIFNVCDISNVLLHDFMDKYNTPDDWFFQLNYQVKASQEAMADKDLSYKTYRYNLIRTAAIAIAAIINYESAGTTQQKT